MRSGSCATAGSTDPPRTSAARAHAKTRMTSLRFRSARIWEAGAALRGRGVSLVEDQPEHAAQGKDHTDEERQGVRRHGDISNPCPTNGSRPLFCSGPRRASWAPTAVPYIKAKLW